MSTALLPAGVHPALVVPTTGIGTPRLVVHHGDPAAIACTCGTPMWATDHPVRTAGEIVALHPDWCPRCYPPTAWPLRTAA